MTDAEITSLCAKAMGWQHLGAIGTNAVSKEKPWCLSGGNDWWINPQGNRICGPCEGIPDPLRDDAQAMMLLQKYPSTCYDAYVKYAKEQFSLGPKDLNRAVCECVATMQSNKEFDQPHHGHDRVE